MRGQDWARFLLLSAIWGSSFVFIRMCAPVFGPFLTASGRLGLAGIALVVYLRVVRFDAQWTRYRWDYLKVGVLASGAPFICFAVGALKLPASLLSILNACTPLFAAIFAAIWLGEGFGWKRALGVALGITGVTLANGLSPIEFTPVTLLAIGITILAPLCYALAGIYIKLRASHLPAQGNAAFSQLMIAPVVALGIPLAPPSGLPSPGAVAALVTLALLCSAVAYLIFYRLMADIGPTKVTTITFVIPVFGMLWGALFLGEVITGGMLIGCAVMLAGTGLVVAPTAKPAS
ncbi:DMT family transporter [Synoicihabitans lomoniglobus]|uniref:DMT family transporter n=1 Tax=Synoicihabitans lomoniglobus TaxID=2909285 RepID=A0AAF0CQH4_9BACT|nr:DMT family transporter [Opitutaceae bacterium LMO-M01]WED66205.1 DMT family transporter [Opitutaceae bacterium LMO-M01]